MYEIKLILLTKPRLIVQSIFLSLDIPAPAANVSGPRLQAHVELLAQEHQRASIFPGDSSHTTGVQAVVSTYVPTLALPETFQFAHRTPVNYTQQHALKHSHV